MAATLPTLQAQLDQLKANRASGIRSVEYNGRRTEFRSDAEMAAAITAIERDIVDLQGSGILRSYGIIAAKGL